MPETEPTLTEVDAEHIETARLAQRQKFEAGRIAGWLLARAEEQDA